MTRTGALLWKEWRDHRTALAVFAAIVPLVSWPVQRWVFKFAEPEWTWQWVVPLCAGLAVATVAADVFATDLATSRMASFNALPISVRRHFTARTAFLVAVALAFAAWTVAVNALVVGVWGKPGAAGALFYDVDAALVGTSMCVTTAAGVVLFSALGVGGFRAVIGGVMLAGIGYVATRYAAAWLFPPQKYGYEGAGREPLLWLVEATVLAGAAYAGFVGGRAHGAGRKRGTLIAAALLVATFGTPAAGAAWKTYRTWALVPDDPELELQRGTNPVSPDGRYVSVWATKQNGGMRTWVVRVEDGALFDWPKWNEAIGGWTSDGLAWAARHDSRVGEELDARLVRPETGETVERVGQAGLERRAVSGLRIEPQWAQWLRRDWVKSKTASKGAPTIYTIKLWSQDLPEERTLETRSSWPAATARVGEVLFVTVDGKLAIVRLAGGEPQVVADDAVGIGGWTAGSPDGRYFIVDTSKGVVVFDSTTWKPAPGPWPMPDVGAYWCTGDAAPATVTVWDRQTEEFRRLVEIGTGREIVPDHALGIVGGYRGVQLLPDGGFVAQAGTNRLLHLDADGKLIRRLFPPEE